MSASWTNFIQNFKNNWKAIIWGLVPIVLIVLIFALPLKVVPVQVKENYWTTEMKGVFGLATRGPQSGCRIGPSVPSLILRNVTAVMEVSPEAAANWEKEIWS